MNKDDFAYDVLSYPSGTFAQTHPDRLAAIGKFYGISTASPECCRVLELGCGDGSNLNWLAYSHPGSEFVGVDLGQTHIEEAKNAADELGLRNVRFDKTDVMEIEPEEYGKFDFIIAHGLFSWVPERVRRKILSLYRQLLIANGIGFVSYNVFPGSHRRRIARNAMRFHTKDIEDPMKQVEEGMSFVKFLVENPDVDPLYRELLKYELDGMQDREKSNIFHDDLAEENQPFYLSEFMNMAEAMELQYLSDAANFTSQPRKLSPETIEAINKLSGKIIELEQYVDFITCPRFRQTLLCHKEQTLDASFSPEKIEDLFISSNLRPVSETVNLADKQLESFSNPKGAMAETDHPLSKAVLLYFYENGSHPVAFDELVSKGLEMLADAGIEVENATQQANVVAGLLFQLYSPDSLWFGTSQSRASASVSERPKASDFARLQLGKGKNVTTFHGLNLEVNNDFTRELLLLLDGSRDKDELLEMLTKIFYSGENDMDVDKLREQLHLSLEESLSGMAKVGLLIG